MNRILAIPIAATLGILTSMSYAEARPTLKFATPTPATEAIESAFKMALDNLIDINSIPYDPNKWNDTGLLETAKDSRFLRAAPSYGDNPWVHDGAYNTWSAMNLLEGNDGRATHVARNTLWACCDVVDGKLMVNIRQSAHSEWYMYQLWNIAAWNYYAITGDTKFLARAYEAATGVLGKQEANHYNAKYGLFEGSYFVGDGVSGFPEPPYDPNINSSNALDYPETHKAMVLSTNCVYVGAYRATAAMAKQLGRPQSEIDQLASKADSVAAAINKHLWIPEKGMYGFFIHGTGTQKAGTLDTTQEGGGISFVIIFGVADAAKTKQILQNAHREPKGITMSWPHFARFNDQQPGRHNVSVWPQINGLFAQAACVGGRVDLFKSEVENLAELFRGSGNIREIYHHISGEPCGGFQKRGNGKIGSWGAVANQAWGAGAFSRMIYYGLFGMDFQPDGIRFAPTLPAQWGAVRLGNLQYRDMTLSITLKGSGNAIRGFAINGKECKEPFVSDQLSCDQDITILLDERKQEEQSKQSPTSDDLKAPEKAGEPEQPFSGVWPSNVPSDCPFASSKDIAGIVFTGRHKEYTDADTFYPSWASDGDLYSPWTDGRIGNERCGSGGGADARTGQAKIVGDDPLNLKVVSLGTFPGSALPYGGRYPCGSLVHDGIWYHGSYCLDRRKGPWDIMAPFVGFRISKDLGQTWTACPLTGNDPLFRESASGDSKVKFGAPHFVDFGKNMEHSPDGKAYLVGHGAVRPEADNSWISGDQVYLARVTPSPENMNDVSKYEFFGGRDSDGKALWTSVFSKVKPLIEWNENAGCVTMTWNAALKKYLMCVTYGSKRGGGGKTDYDTYILESGSIGGSWKIVTYMKAFGPQAYFVNIPSKFISADGKTMWLCYSANWSRKNEPGVPAGSRYALCLREIKLLWPMKDKVGT